MKKYAIVLLALVLIGCGRKKVVEHPMSVGLLRYKGQFVTFQYPSSAKLTVISAKESYLLGPLVPIPARPEAGPSTLRGPKVPTRSVSSENAQQGDYRHAYQIHIEVHDNPLGLTAEQWAREHIIEEWKRIQGGPSIYPVSQDGHIMEDYVSLVRVGNETAFMMDAYGYAENTRSLYFAKSNVIIEMSFVLYPLETEPLALMQKDIYALILGTLSFVK